MATISRLKTIINGITHIFDQVALGGAEDSQGNSAGNMVVAPSKVGDASLGSLPLGTEVTVTVTAVLTKVGEIGGSGLVEVEVTSADLDQFEIRAVTSRGEQTLASTTADFNDESAMAGILEGTSGDLTSQAVGVGYFILKPSSTKYAIYAASSGASSGVTLHV